MEFVYMHRAEFQALEIMGPYQGKEEAQKFIETVARKWLVYDKATYWIDIYLTLRRDLQRLISKEHGEGLPL